MLRLYNHDSCFWFNKSGQSQDPLHTTEQGRLFEIYPAEGF